MQNTWSVLIHLNQYLFIIFIIKELRYRPLPWNCAEYIRAFKLWTYIWQLCFENFLPGVKDFSMNNLVYEYLDITPFKSNGVKQAFAETTFAMEQYPAFIQQNVTSLTALDLDGNTHKNDIECFIVQNLKNHIFLLLSFIDSRGYGVKLCSLSSKTMWYQARVYHETYSLLIESIVYNENHKK